MQQEQGANEIQYSYDVYINSVYSYDIMNAQRYAK